MEEIWKDIDGYDGIYQVSNLGRVKSLERTVNSSCRVGGVRTIKEKIFKEVTKNRYVYISLSNNGIDKKHYVHRLVATAFIPNLEHRKEVNHKNGIKSDNRIENLEWATPSENQKHSYDTGLNYPKYAMKGKFGKDNPTSKSVLQFDLNGNFIREYAGISEAKRLTGANGIWHCLSGKKKQSGGYVWKRKI